MNGCATGTSPPHLFSACGMWQPHPHHPGPMKSLCRGHILSVFLSDPAVLNMLLGRAVDGEGRTGPLKGRILSRAEKRLTAKNAETAEKKENPFSVAPWLRGSKKAKLSKPQRRRATEEQHGELCRHDSVAVLCVLCVLCG